MYIPMKSTCVGLGGLPNALVETTTMSITLEEDMRVEDEVVPQAPAMDYMESTIKSPPPVTTQLARTLGMPSQRVQIMKASFFDSDMDGMQDYSSSNIVLTVCYARE